METPRRTGYLGPASETGTRSRSARTSARSPGRDADGGPRDRRKPFNRVGTSRLSIWRPHHVETVQQHPVPASVVGSLQGERRSRSGARLHREDHRRRPLGLSPGNRAVSHSFKSGAGGGGTPSTVPPHSHTSSRSSCSTADTSSRAAPTRSWRVHAVPISRW